MIKHCQITHTGHHFTPNVLKWLAGCWKSTRKCLTLEFQHSNFCCVARARDRTDLFCISDSLTLSISISNESNLYPVFWVTLRILLYIVGTPPPPPVWRRLVLITVAWWVDSFRLKIIICLKPGFSQTEYIKTIIFDHFVYYNCFRCEWPHM